eukprot:s1118_g4.t1
MSIPITAAPEVPVGTNEGSVAANTALPYCDYTSGIRPCVLQPTQVTHVLVHTVSTLEEQTTPTWKNVSDTNFQVTNLNIDDLDLDLGELGGSVVWDVPAAESLVTHYNLYFGRLSHSYGTDSWGEWELWTPTQDLLLGTSIWWNFINIAAETAIGSSDYLLLYAASALQEQTWPATRYIPDDFFDVRELTFTDLDLDPAELGGVLDWKEHSYRYKVESYHVYLASDAAGTGRKRLTNETGVASGTSEFDVPADTSVTLTGGATATHFVVYQQTSLAEETTPAALAISDTGVLFTDLDLDVNELGGNVSWEQPALDTSLISHYLVYFSMDSAGADRDSATYDECAVHYGRASDLGGYANNTEYLYDYILVYAKSSWAEQTTPSYIRIVDSDMPDLDIVDLQGQLDWTPPENVSGEVITYAVYLAQSADGLNKELVNWTGSLDGYNLTELELSGALSYIQQGEVPFGVNTFAVPSGTYRDSHSHFVVFSRSALAEATTPSFLSFASAAINASVKEINLTDDDLDDGDIGGELVWQLPSILGRIVGYHIYVAEDTSSSVRTQLSSVAVSKTDYLVPENTIVAANRYINIHSYSSLREQSTPVTHEFYDAFAAGIQDGDHITAIAQQKTQLAATDRAFALWRCGGDTVVTWGYAGSGGDSSAVQDQLRSVQQIQASYKAFAAILADGSVIAWGNPENGGDSSAVQDQLKNVQQVQATDAAFAALLSDGSVVTWGEPEHGGDSSAVQDQLRRVEQIRASHGAFAAVLADGSVITWGLPDFGGDSSAVQDQLRNLRQIQGSRAFAAILEDGSVVTWGDPDYGGDSSAVQDQLTSVQQIRASYGAFAGILSDGSVVTWGDPKEGGDSSTVQDQLRNVQQIQALPRAFAALLADGSVVVWGDPAFCGACSVVQDQLRHFQQIQASPRASAAILADGSVITWGHPNCGGDSSAVQDQLRNVQQVQATDCAFAALLSDGSVVTWGDPNEGGDSSEVQEQANLTDFQWLDRDLDLGEIGGPSFFNPPDYIYRSLL